MKSTENYIAIEIVKKLKGSILQLAMQSHPHQMKKSIHIANVPNVLSLSAEDVFPFYRHQVTSTVIEKQSAPH